jgi:hypothetical protein
VAIAGQMRAATGPVWTELIWHDAGGGSRSWGLGVASGDRLRDALLLASGGGQLFGVREQRIELLARRGAPGAGVEPFGEAGRFSTHAC